MSETKEVSEVKETEYFGMETNAGISSFLLKTLQEVNIKLQTDNK
jgi:hypothetical protein